MVCMCITLGNSSETTGLTFISLNRDSMSFVQLQLSACHDSCDCTPAIQKGQITSYYVIKNDGKSVQGRTVLYSQTVVNT